MSYYDEISEGYDGLHEEEQLRKIGLIKAEIDHLEDHMLLDVGCGTGISMRWFPYRKVGIDPSLELIRQSKFPVINGVAESLPFRSNTFDIVQCITAVHNFVDIDKGIGEMRRVGKEIFIISVLKKSHYSEKIKKIIKGQFYINKIVEDIHDDIYILNDGKH